MHPLQAHDYLKHHPGTTLQEVVLLGICESMSPGILGFTVLSLIALILALGVYARTRASPLVVAISPCPEPFS